MKPSDAPKSSGIYRITCLPNGRIYIGSAKCFKTRLSLHISQLNALKHGNPHLQNAWTKHGPDNFNFEIVELCECAALLAREQVYLDSVPKQTRFNICAIAGSSFGLKRSQETRDKLRAAKIGKKISNAHREALSLSHKGLKMTQVTIERMRLAQSNRSEEWRRRLSEVAKGRIFSESTIEKLRLARRRRIITEETRLKISNSLKGRRISLETRQKLSLASKNRPQSVIAKISASKMGHVVSPETRAKISQSLIARNRNKLLNR